MDDKEDKEKDAFERGLTIGYDIGAESERAKMRLEKIKDCKWQRYHFDGPLCCLKRELDHSRIYCDPDDCPLDKYPKKKCKPRKVICDNCPNSPDYKGESKWENTTSEIKPVNQIGTK